MDFTAFKQVIPAYLKHNNAVRDEVGRDSQLEVLEEEIARHGHRHPAYRYAL
jgi:hypothetical protein